MEQKYCLKMCTVLKSQCILGHSRINLQCPVPPYGVAGHIGSSETVVLVPILKVPRFKALVNSLQLVHRLFTFLESDGIVRGIVSLLQPTWMEVSYFFWYCSGRFLCGSGGSRSRGSRWSS